VTKTRISALLKKEILKEMPRSFYNITLELNLQTFSISNTNVDTISWATIKKFLQELFYDFPVKIILCDNHVTDKPERNKIITENHASAIGGHKGITKTYKEFATTIFG